MKRPIRWGVALFFGVLGILLFILGIPSYLETIYVFDNSGHIVAEELVRISGLLDVILLVVMFLLVFFCHLLLLC